MIKKNKQKVLFLKEEFADGQGKYNYSNGESYVGDWKNGKYHGQGIRFWERDGHELKYEGEWRNGNENGQWELTISSCDKRDLSFYVYAGEWKDGDHWNITTYDKDGNYKWKYVKGVKK